MDVSVEVCMFPGESGDAADNAEMSSTANNTYLENEVVNPFQDSNIGDESLRTDLILVDNTENHNNTEVECIKVFVKRDYSVRRFIRFEKTFPTALEGKIEKEIFEDTINQLNNYFEEPEKNSCYTCTEGCLACLTAHLIYIFKQTPYEKCLKKVSKYVAEQNVAHYEPKGLKLVDPSLRGLRVLEISTLETKSSD